MRKATHLARYSRSLLVALVALAGCQKKGDKIPNGDYNSGLDKNRSGATLILVNKDYLDRVDIGSGDMTDWKSVELKGKADAMTVDLRWDNAQADLTLDAFDPSGAQIASSPVNSGVPAKKLIVPIDNTPATYYLRVQALTPKQASDYTIIAHWEGEAAAPPPPPPTAPPPDEVRKPVVKHTPSAPKPPKKSKGKAEDGLQGRVVSARKEGDGMVLFIDKGRAAGVAEGQNGWILEGPSGYTEFGTFTISAVVDENRSIGKTSLKSLAKNNRISINVGK